MPCRSSAGYAGPKQLLLVFALGVFGAATFATKVIGQDTGKAALTESQSFFPELRPKQTLTAPNELRGLPGLYQTQSGNSNLTISPDGKRLAAYIRYGVEIETWSPDSTYRKAIPRYTSIGLDSYVLHFLDGHRLLISSPAADTNDAEGWKKVEDAAFSVVDADTGKVLRNIPGPNPGAPSNKNIALEIAISPDERLVAAIIRQLTERRVVIFSTDDWHQVTELDLRTTGTKEDDLDPHELAFSPDGKSLAIAHGFHGRVKFFEVGSWRLVRSIITFPETPPPLTVSVLGAIAFSPDGSMIAVASLGGGSWWVSADGRPTKEGAGAFKQEFPADPLRVYRVSDGARVNSLGSFPGGLSSNARLAWSIKGDYLAFLDGLGNVRFWNPNQPGLSTVVAHIGPHSESILLSKNGSQLFANFPDGIKIFDIVANLSK